LNDDPPKQDEQDTVTPGITNPVGRGRVAPSDAAFDLWLKRGLHAMYDEVAKEPVPPALLALIERDRQKK